MRHGDRECKDGRPSPFMNIPAPKHRAGNLCTRACLTFIPIPCRQALPWSSTVGIQSPRSDEELLVLSGSIVYTGSYLFELLYRAVVLVRPLRCVFLAIERQLYISNTISLGSSKFLPRQRDVNQPGPSFEPSSSRPGLGFMDV